MSRSLLRHCSNKNVTSPFHPPNATPSRKHARPPQRIHSPHFQKNRTHPFPLVSPQKQPRLLPLKPLKYPSKSHRKKPALLRQTAHTPRTSPPENRNLTPRSPHRHCSNKNVTSPSYPPNATPSCKHARPPQRIRRHHFQKNRTHPFPHVSPKNSHSFSPQASKMPL